MVTVSIFARDLTMMQKTISVATCKKSTRESKTIPGVVDVQNCSFCRQIILEAESAAVRQLSIAGVQYGRLHIVAGGRHA
jgi:hypothetical protein